MPRASQAELIERRRAEAGRGSSEGGDGASARFVDLQLELWAEDELGARTGESLGAIGGLWDRRERDYVGGAPTVRSLGIHPGQLPAMRWFLDWLGDYLEGVEKPIDERIFSLLLAGGQRSGKTWLGVLLCNIFAVAFPGSIVWIVCPTDKDFEEVQELLRSIMQPEWFVELGAPWFRYQLANGSRIVLRSGHVPGRLKKGDADFILINEAQQQDEKNFAISRARIAAAGGLVVVAANPPDKPVGTWVGNFAADAQAGLRQALYFPISPLENPHIDKAPLIAMRAEFDELTYDTQVLGLFRSTKDAVLYNWDRTLNELAPPTSGEMTREFLKVREGRAFDRVVGIDVQRHPHMAAVEFKFFENPLALTGRDRFDFCWMWATAELVLQAADEDDLAASFLEAGWDPDRTLLVVDASAWWQFAERDPTKVKEKRDQVKGRGSIDIFRRYGFRYAVKPDRDMEKNPDVIERCRSATSRIAVKMKGDHGQRFLFSDPINRELNEAVRSWPTKHGEPMRTSKYAHLGDAFTYPVHRFFPRRRRADEKPNVKVIERRRNAAGMRGW